MNFFICKCDKNQCQEEKTAMDLLDIKNLEKTLKDKEKEILRSDNINMIETRNDTDFKDNISNDDELEIIEYPYTIKEDNNKKDFNTKPNRNKNNINNQTKNSPKSNNFKKCKNLLSLNNKLQPKEDLNSSLNNESSIIDDNEYLNDEDTPIKGKKIKNDKNVNNKPDLLYKRKIMKKNNTNINKKNNSHIISHDKLKDESLKNRTKKMIPSNKNNNKNKQKCLSYKKDEQNLSKKLCNLNPFDNSAKSRNKNYHSLNKTYGYNNKVKSFIEHSFVKKEKDNNLTYIYNNKRINKRKINLKKSKLQKYIVTILNNLIFNDNKLLYIYNNNFRHNYIN